jgi:membrane protein CcdC involved in cytochrome C biogenesis
LFKSSDGYGGDVPELSHGCRVVDGAAPQQVHAASEQLVLLCRFFMSAGIMFLQNDRLQATGAMVTSAALHGLIMSCMMVRFSSFVPMQLVHVLTMLYRSRPGIVLCSLQLLAWGVWLPCVVLCQWEVRTRSAFLVHLGLDCKASSCDGSILRE